MHDTSYTKDDDDHWSTKISLLLHLRVLQITLKRNFLLDLNVIFTSVKLHH